MVLGMEVDKTSAKESAHLNFLLQGSLRNESVEKRMRERMIQVQQEAILHV